MRVYLQGGKAIDIDQSDFIASGGEGAIYGKGDNIYKIYTDMKKVISQGKIDELSQIGFDNVNIPLELIRDNNGNNIGYLSKWIKNAEPLCRYFISSYQKKTGIDIMKVVGKKQDTIERIHKKKCLLVDGNEFNYLIKNDIPFFIDVANYSTQSYGSSVMLPAVRDWLYKDIVDELSDWFSFAIVIFQLFTGIHPFKGKCNKNYSLEERIKNRLSVLSKSIIPPRSMRPISCIPKEYRNWFIEIFNSDNRKYPPKIAGGKYIIKINTDISDSVIKYVLLKEYDEEILCHIHINGIRIVKTKSFIYYNSRRIKTDSDEEVLLLGYQYVPVFVSKSNDRLILRSPDLEINKIDIVCEDFFIYKNNLFIKSNNNIINIIFSLKKKIIIGIGLKWKIMPYSTRFYSNCVVQNMIGARFIMIPDGNKLYLINKLPFLKDHKIISCKYYDRFLYILSFHDNNYHRIIVKFNKNFDSYDLLINKNITDRELNFTVLNNGICIYKTEDKIKLTSDLKRFKEIKADNLILSGEDNSLIGFNDNKLYKLVEKRKNYK